MNYKNTLLIPKTTFEMRGNLTNKEPEIQKMWEEKEIYKKILISNKNQKKFILHDGPPYANGNLHMGHALNKILKDIIIRHKNNLGFYAPFVCGWDTHGLPIENAISKNKKIKINNLSTSELRSLCNDYALSQVEIQSKQFKRLGILTDFNIKYLTLSKDYQIAQLELFKSMCENNLIYRNMKPIYWSPSSKTALAEAEIEYKNLISPSIYVVFDIIDAANKNLINNKIIIWTTTPWTIPANSLLAVGKNFNYIQFEYKNSNYIIAEKLLEQFKNKLKIHNLIIKNTFLGKDLIGIKTKHPLYNRESKVVNGHHVTVNSGTGIVHIAPGFGEDDYLIGKKENISIYVPINDYGKFTSEINDKDLENVFYEDSNKIIINKLRSNNKLLFVEEFQHQYPVDWRTKKPVIFRATEQWFVSIDKIKSKLLKELQNVNWHQDWAKNTMINMIKDRTDWCISRQRSWGVPIIAFYDKENKPIIKSEIILHVINLFKKNDINIWYEWDCDKLLPKKFQNLNWKKEKDIMDVWFDSGSSNIFMNKKFNFNIPFDLYLEGRDQFRGWFNSSLITSTIQFNKAPYKKLITHGFINDEKGFKMSKSLGNGIELTKIYNTYGVDILRLWVSSVDYSSDVRIGDNIIKQIADSYKKIRNTIRFILGNLYDFNFKTDSKKELNEVDEYILYKTKKFQEESLQIFNNYDFHLFYSKATKYVNNDLSAFYLDFIKDILYIENANSIRRRQVQTTLYYILEALMNCFKSILVHTMEEVYLSLNKIDKKDSVFLEKWNIIDRNFNLNFINKWEKIMKFRNDVNKALEIARENKIIKKSIETSISVYPKKEFLFLKEIVDLNQILIVSELLFVNNNNVNYTEYNSSYIKIDLKKGKKCERCWTIVDEVQNNICNKCTIILKN